MKQREAVRSPQLQHLYEMIRYERTMAMAFPNRGHEEALERYMKKARQAEATALRGQAEQLEHGAEFSVNETLAWTREEQAANNRAINEARALRDRADAMERGARVAI